MKMAKAHEHGSSKWPTHSWRIAIDYDPDFNQLKREKDKNAFARPEYYVPGRGRIGKPRPHKEQ